MGARPRLPAGVRRRPKWRGGDRAAAALAACRALLAAPVQGMGADDALAERERLRIEADAARTRQGALLLEVSR